MDDVPMTRWLNETELQAWLKLAGVMLKLSPTLDSQLQRDSDMTHFDYLCLAMLSESDDRTLRMGELAALTNASLSRLSHVITKLEKRGWVCRRRSPDSGRVTLVHLDDEGWKVLVKPRRPATSRRCASWSSTASSADDVAALERIAGSIVARIEASAPEVDLLSLNQIPPGVSWSDPDPTPGGSTHVQSRHLQPLRQGQLHRLRPARRPGAARRPAGPALLVRARAASRRA